MAGVNEQSLLLSTDNKITFSQFRIMLSWFRQKIQTFTFCSIQFYIPYIFYIYFTIPQMYNFVKL